MTKILKLLFINISFLFLYGTIVLGECTTINFTNSNVCIDIVRKTGNTFQLNTTINNNSNTSIAIKCDILLPDNSLRDVSQNGCKGEFNYDKKLIEKVKLYIRVNNEYKNLEKYYDFNYGRRDSNNNTNQNLNSFDIYLSDSTPDVNQKVTLDIEALDSGGYKLSNYIGSNAYINIYYRTSSSSSWIKTTSSTYFVMDSYSPSFSNGRATTYITFKRNLDYKIEVNDDYYNKYSSKIYYVGQQNNNTNQNLNSFDIYLSDSTPDVDQKVTLDIEALDSGGYKLSNYVGSNAYINIYYRTSSSSSWIKTTSSTYFVIDSYSPSFSNGRATTYITFKRNLDYKIEVNDDYYNKYSSKIYYVSAKSSTNGFTVKELNQIKGIYNLRPKLRTNLEKEYYKLKLSTTRKNMTTTFYNNMSDIINNKSNRTLKNYDDFFESFIERYLYTMKTR